MSSSTVHPKLRCIKLILTVSVRAAGLSMLTHRFPGKGTCPCRSYLIRVNSAGDARSSGLSTNAALQHLKPTALLDRVSSRSGNFTRNNPIRQATVASDVTASRARLLASNTDRRRNSVQALYRPASLAHTMSSYDPRGPLMRACAANVLGWGSAMANHAHPSAPVQCSIETPSETDILVTLQACTVEQLASLTVHCHLYNFFISPD